MKEKDFHKRLHTQCIERTIVGKKLNWPEIKTAGLKKITQEVVNCSLYQTPKTKLKK